MNNFTILENTNGQSLTNIFSAQIITLLRQDRQTEQTKLFVVNRGSRFGRTLGVAFLKNDFSAVDKLTALLLVSNSGYFANDLDAPIISEKSKI